MASGCGGGFPGFLCHGISFIPIIGGWWDVGQHFAPKALHAVTGSVLSDVAQAMSSAADGLLHTLTSFWMNINTPDMSAGSPVDTIEHYLGWVTACVSVICILVAAARMAIRRRGEPAGAMLLGLVRLVVVSASATFLMETAGKLADLFSSDLMNAAHLGSGGWSGMISTAALSAAFAPGNGMLLIIALLIIISSLIQLMLMVLRVGLMVILTGTLPLAAAASMSDWGQAWWRKHLGWLTAWLLYKPAAALLFAGAIALTHGKDLPEVLSGFMLLVLSVLILPALLKVIVPMTTSLGAASTGSLAMGAAGALATGAIKAASLGRGATAAPTGNQLPAGGKSAASDGAEASPSSQRQAGLSSASVSPSGAEVSGPQADSGGGGGTGGPQGSVDVGPATSPDAGAAAAGRQGPGAGKGLGGESGHAVSASQAAAGAAERQPSGAGTSDPARQAGDGGHAIPPSGSSGATGDGADRGAIAAGSGGSGSGAPDMSGPGGAGAPARPDGPTGAGDSGGDDGPEMGG